jgi:hypothetical protein
VLDQPKGLGERTAFPAHGQVPLNSGIGVCRQFAVDVRFHISAHPVMEKGGHRRCKPGLLVKPRREW